MKALKSFDLVTFLIVLAGRIAKRRHEKLVAREQALRAAITATQNAYADTVQKRLQADWRHQDIAKVK